MRAVLKHLERVGAFSLMEVTLALGILSVAMVGILSLLPAALGGFRQSMDTTITAQLFDRVLSEVEATDFDALFDDAASNSDGVAKASDTSGTFSAMSRRYFDEDGRELKKSESRTAKYLLHTRLSHPGVADPKSHKDAYFTSLPQYQRPVSGTDGPRFNPRDGTIVTLQILTLPGTRSPDAIADELLVKSKDVDTSKAVDDRKVLLLLSPDRARNLKIPLQMRSSFVVRFGYRT
jgi:uncharacterized protein (TIGR02598 family)